jgi:hypothetical protein
VSEISTATTTATALAEHGDGGLGQHELAGLAHRQPRGGGVDVAAPSTNVKSLVMSISSCRGA